MNSVSSSADVVDRQWNTKLVFRWSDKVSQLRREYSWLLFFSVPKLLLLHSLVDELQPDLAAIVAEISFLFENDSDVRKKLTNVVKVRSIIDNGSINCSFHHFS